MEKHTDSKEEDRKLEGLRTRDLKEDIFLDQGDEEIAEYMSDRFEEEV